MRNRAHLQEAGSRGTLLQILTIFKPCGRVLPALLLMSPWLTASRAAASELKSDERLILYPAIARRVADGCEIELHGLVYEPGRHRLMTRALRRSLGIDEEDITPAEAALFRERMEYFLVDNERGKKFSVRIGGTVHRLNASAANGHFTTRFALTADQLPSAATGGSDANFVLNVEVPASGGQTRNAPLEVHLLGETGVSVISDIDDTIKISEVLNRKGLVRNTFCRPFKAVTGMAGVYRTWAAEGAQFHYLTASPWQLYLPLSEFTRSNGFPVGTFFMKNFRAKDLTLFQLFASPEHYKPKVIESLLRQFPKRQFVLVGDSGEKDPEIYGAVARKHPDQVKAILIRDVTGEQADSPRYRKAFADVPSGRWQVFKEPSEIMTPR
jgi:Uncharacterized conserved protein (DUF2183)